MICDRFIDSTRAYQGGGGGLSDDDILALHQIGSGGLLPDLTILLEVPATVAQVRLEARDGADSDAIGGREAAYHARVAARFAQIAEAEAVRFARLDTSGTREETHAGVMAALAPLLERAA